jgi:hypothetical protein
MSTWPMITIRVVPRGDGAHAAPTGAFTVLESADYQPVVYREEEHSDVFLEGADKVSDYQRIAARLAEMALGATASRDLIAKSVSHVVNLTSFLKHVSAAASVRKAQK